MTLDAELAALEQAATVDVLDLNRALDRLAAPRPSAIADRRTPSLRRLQHRGNRRKSSDFGGHRKTRLERRAVVAAARADMTTDRWERIKQITGEALELEPGRREAFLAEACADDADLRAEVATLLAAEDPSGRFLEPDPPPDRIGPYRVVREIGRGGMGTVYEGRRADAQFEQRVAIKVVKRGMDTDAVLRRFYAERQILARLQHPHIARLFDGGITADGRPYFVMEYLEATALTAHCDARALSVHARIDLFIVVCDAVEYAHSHLVLHRDLKPANIVVDASGAPKLLDFGIAKLLDETDLAGMVTDAGQRAMTPLYASPEQRRGEPLTTASDVLARGLILQALIPDAARRGDLDRIVRKALEGRGAPVPARG